MVKYQAFIVIKQDSARKRDVILVATLTKLFSLDYIRSLASDGNWGTLNLIPPSTIYNNWQRNWNKNNIWSDNNAYIPFYLFQDYKSGANSFVDQDGNILHEGRLKELFLLRFGVDVEYLTNSYVL